MLTQKLSKRRFLVDILALLFGLGAWIGINGIYVQLPLLVNNAPEGWTLPAYMVMLVQIANLGPLLYTLYVKYSSCIGDKTIIYCLLGSAVSSTYALSSLYDKTSGIFGEEHSTHLLGLMFITAVVGCTSSVLFMPYMRNYREIYLISYLVGEGLSGFIPSIVALIQGVGGNPTCVNVTKSNDSKLVFDTHYPDPRFSTRTFFIFLATCLLLSFIAFLGLNKLRIARCERVHPLDCTENLPTTMDMNTPASYKTDILWTMSRRTYQHLLIMMGLVCFLGNGMLPSIQSFSCLPYGNIAYHLTVTLSSMAGPLAMCLGFVIKNPQIRNLQILTVMTLLLSILVFFLALKSPTPPLQNSWLGEMIVILSWVAVCGLIGFIKMGITTLFRPDPGKGLYYTGVATQVGSLVGALLTFCLVNYIKVFQTYSPCSSLIEEKFSI
ncbi:solute carrier family 52, riboflavin transporter, member 3-A-like [Leptopilina boulardi]|uniref:solute carrier family 52, riboflavin transporter, member 3-A-like n=1 Tax=Leptopilina boulardi TaxID=63433 RepID=UPI0021F678DE|nr:solute carrier family 52, riboflavin transporter, member 3-A-like [Leptopilina boulardi]XP_051159716.1 solute carrier family 52, riboflavin transporter, member 3-A-like [Leptopilina boulardi]XP_051159717.1 solute carrier family 52, riboflavin transporter, member 3-A-like [Leptopilina boulardi]